MSFWSARERLDLVVLGRDRDWIRALTVSLRNEKGGLGSDPGDHQHFNDRQK